MEDKVAKTSANSFGIRGTYLNFILRNLLHNSYIQFEKGRSFDFVSTYLVPNGSISLNIHSPIFLGYLNQ